MFTPGRVAITLIAILVAVILYWVTKILSVTTMALVEVNFTSWPTWGQLTFQAFPVLALIFLFVWAFRQLNPERDLGETEPHPFRMAGSALGLVKKSQFTPSSPIVGQFVGQPKKKKKKSGGDAFDL